MKKYFFVLITLIGTLSSAEPFKYSNCNHINIKQPENSSGYYMNSNCNVVYVLPPSEGQLKVTSYMSAVTSAQCDAITSKLQLLELSLNNAKRYSKILYDQLTKLNEAIILQRELESQCTAFDEAIIEVQIKRLELDSTISEANLLKVSLEGRLSQCQANGRSCRSDERALESLKDRILRLEQAQAALDIREKQFQVRKDGCIRIAAARSGRQGVNREALLADIAAQKQQVDAEIVGYKNEIESEAGEVGGNVSFAFVLGYAKLVEEFKFANPTLAGRVAFERLPLKNMQLSFSAILNGIDAKIPVILNSEIPGVTYASERSSIDQSLLSLDSVAQNNLIMGESLGGRMTINRLVACSANSTDMERIADIIKANYKYEYELQTRRKYKVDYNEKHLYQMIKERSSNNGFFSASSAEHLTEKSVGNQWIDIKIESQDANHGFTNSDQLANDLRREYLDSALTRVLKGYLEGSAPGLPDVSEPGGRRVSDTLKKCPHIYCQAAGLVLDLGSALFGGSNSSSTYSRILRAEAGTSFEEIRPVTFYGSASFKVDRSR